MNMPSAFGNCGFLVAGFIALFVSPDETIVSAPAARIQTDPVPSDGDSCDDPAIWIHPADPAMSLVIGTDKKGGLHSYSLDGRERQFISPGSRPNNVDILYGFTYKGQKTDLAIATVGKESNASGVKIWTISPDGNLAELAEGPTFRAFEGGDPYGLCTYRSPNDRTPYVFVTDREGRVEQYRLESGESIRAELVRSFLVGSQSEGIVADRELGKLYVAEEGSGIWEYSAEPSGGTERQSVARVGQNGLTADVEGLTIYYGSGGKGYLLASSQGSSTINVYDRSTRAYVLTIDPRSGTFGDVAHTDGLDVTNERTSPQFPAGFLVVQDGENPGRQNFKLFAWEEIAGDRLIVDTSAKAR